MNILFLSFEDLFAFFFHTLARLANFFLFFYCRSYPIMLLYLVLVAKRSLQSTVNYCFFLSLFFFPFSFAGDSIFSLTSLIHSQTRAFKSTGITIAPFLLPRYFAACLFPSPPLIFPLYLFVSLLDLRDHLQRFFVSL